MSFSNQSRAILVLADGTVEYGYAVGQKGVVEGEICFSNGKVNTNKIFTDPIYYNHLLMMDHQQIRSFSFQTPNMGQRMVSGFIGDDNLEENPSIKKFLERSDVIGIAGIDTKRILRQIRFKGAMNAVISSTVFDEEKLLKRTRRMTRSEAGPFCKTVFNPIEKVAARGPHKVAVIDYGNTPDITKHLSRSGCNVRIFSSDAFTGEIDAWNPDGVLLSDGPGNPQKAFRYADTILNYAKHSGIPLFGIGLGHQLMALAGGFSVSKKNPKYRGTKQPVKNLINRQVKTVPQSHVFSVDHSIDDRRKAEITHININDRSIEGLRFKDYQGFSLQYNPKMLNNNFLFRHFIDLLGTQVSKKRKVMEC